MAKNPLTKALEDWLPEVDFGIMHHGWAKHGRDYVFVIEASGTYQLTLTHVVALKYETRVRDDVWPSSWDDTFLDYQAWIDAGEPGGYVWGTNWSLAYPGLTAPDDEPEATDWSVRLGREMHAMTVETDRFRLSMIFHEARSRKIGDDAPTLRQAIHPL
jgi:hypothetical protein